MIILDTNIISEVSKQLKNERVLEWFDANTAREPLYTTSITVAELRLGMLNMPEGKRKNALIAFLNDILECFFLYRILPFDHGAAEQYAQLSSRLYKSGMNIDQNDLMIAAIALEHDAVFATRNVKHFEPCGVNVVNPFEAAVQ
jgi:predicted nucleic acid-binding protein